MPSNATPSYPTLCELFERTVRSCAQRPALLGPGGEQLTWGEYGTRVAELEAGLIGERTKNALAAAKARGVKLGNPNGARALRGERGRNAARVSHRDVHSRAGFRAAAAAHRLS